ncbi:MAG: AraC family transcriptional regulator [Bacteroidetes bacterium]|nr:AraC family transcriptional regulator [Bacteroidota bacterium]
MKGRGETIKDYQERINKVLVYISEHLDEKLELEKLAAMSNFSVFHFHRIFRAFLNEPLGTFVTRLRLDYAAKLLEFGTDPISEIAYKVGFEVPSSLNKAFKKRFGVTPVEFRETKKALIPFDFIHLNSKAMELNLKPQIKEINEKKVIYVQAIGKYADSAGKAWDQLCEFMKQEKLFTFGLETIGIGHDDPSVTDSDKLRYDACMTIKKDVQPKGNIGVKVIAGGKYAIFKYKGPYTNLEQVYNYIFKNWLPASNYELEDKPCFEKYLNNPEKHKPENYKTHIYVPLK